MKYRSVCFVGLTVVLVSLAARQAEAIQAYAIEDLNVFLSFDTATPGTVTQVLFSGETTRLDGLDFRPADGKLYGYDQSSNKLVTVNTATGVTTLVTTLATASSTNDLGLDFNPVADRLRLVNLDDQNLRIVPDTGAVPGDTALAYAAGDTNVGANPSVIEAAYTNNFAGAVSTKLYYIDSALNILATTDAPNGGQITTVGTGLGVGLDDRYVGFDIFTSGGIDTAYAILTEEGIPRLYTIDLTTGLATSLGLFGQPEEFSEVYSLALVPVPEPSSLALFATAAIGSVVLRRRRRG